MCGEEESERKREREHPLPDGCFGENVIDQVGSIINLIDIEPAQIFIDVRFVTTSNRDVLNYGVAGEGPTMNPGDGNCFSARSPKCHLLVSTSGTARQYRGIPAQQDLC